MAEGNHKSAKPNQSVEKVFSIIEFLAEKEEPLRLLDISQGLKLSSSTALRFLTTLENCGYVSQDKETLKYCLTYKICNIANHVSAHASVRDVAHPYLKRLSRALGESVCLAVEQDMMVVYIDVVEGPDQMLRTMQRIGNIAPIHCTGIGKLLLLEYSDKRLDRMIAAKGLPRFTENTLTTKEQLCAALRRIRADGCAYDNEECEVGARCVALPIRDYTGKIIAGFSVTGPSSRVTDGFIARWSDALFCTAAEISRGLGYCPPRKDAAAE